MKKIRIMVGLAVAAAVLAAWFPAQAQILGDFKVGSAVSAGSVLDIAVTPNDRFVVVLGTNQLRYLDTWNFQMVPNGLGAAAFTSITDGVTITTKALALSPDGKYAFVARSDGKITTVTLSPLYSLLPEQSLVSELAASSDTVVPTGASTRVIDHLAALPDGHLLFTAGTVTYASTFASGAVSSTVSTIDNVTGKSVIELVRGASHAYELYKITSPSNSSLLRIHSCTTTGCSFFRSYPSVLTGSTPLAGLAADPRSDNFVLTSDPVVPELWIMDTGLATIPLNTLSSPAAVKLAVLPSPNLSTTFDLVFSAQSGSAHVGISEVNASGPAFVGATSSLATPESFTKLAASSGADSYVYGSGGTLLRPVTANPLIDPVKVEVGATVYSGATVANLTTGFTVDIKVHSAAGLAWPLPTEAGIFTDQVFGYANWTTQLPDLNGAAIPLLVGDTTEVTLHYGATALAALPFECGNVITVVVVDAAGHKGRTAFTVNVDRAPPPQPFDLSFGNQILMYSLNTMDLCDLSKIEVWYSANPTVTDGYTSLVASKTQSAIYTGLSAGQHKFGTIGGLTNGVLYYVWVVAFDKTGHSTLSLHTGMPQSVLTLTDLTHEKGGKGGCFGAVTGQRRGDPAELALLLAPLLIGGGLRLFHMMRVRRGSR